MSLVAVRYLGNDTITGINFIEDWYLPKDAFKTQFTDTADRTLYLIGTRQDILDEDKKLDIQDAVHHHYGYTFTYQGN